MLTTGNKSEMATGYCTLYGDMAGGFAVIKDVLKTLVYRSWRAGATQHDRVRTAAPTGDPRAHHHARRPSAELRAEPDRPGQPAALRGARRRSWRATWKNDQSIEEIVAAGFERADVERVTRLIKINEYKRRQAPVGIRDHPPRRSARDWRYPITCRFRA
mgnify:CR=1 FL=1